MMIKIFPILILVLASTTAQAVDFCTVMFDRNTNPFAGPALQISEYSCTGSNSPVEFENARINAVPGSTSGFISTLTLQVSAQGWELVTLTSDMPIGSYVAVFRRE